MFDCSPKPSTREGPLAGVWRLEVSWSGASRCPGEPQLQSTIYTPSSQSSARGHTGGHRRKVARGHGERVHCNANHHRAAQISLRFLPPNFVIISRILLRWWENVQNKMRSWRIALSFLPGKRLERGSETSLFQPVCPWFCLKLTRNELYLISKIENISPAMLRHLNVAVNSKCKNIVNSKPPYWST